MADPQPAAVPSADPPRPIARFAWLSIGAAVVTIAMKGVAWRLTGSVGLLSDALESFVNLAAAVLTLAMLAVAARPPDEAHAYGYSKAEFFASGAEGAFILLAAVAIAWTAVRRLLAPVPIEQPGLGLAVSTGASLVNLVVARVLLAASRRQGSIALEADARHLMTDVWTSAGVIVGVLLVALTGWQPLDPIVALAVAANIVRTGFHIVRRSALGLLDRALPVESQEAVRRVLARHGSEAVQFHSVRTIEAGARRFVSLHVLVPGDWSVRRGHALAEEIEADLRDELGVIAFTHLEAIDDPASFEDQGLDRPVRPARR